MASASPASKEASAEDPRPQETHGWSLHLLRVLLLLAFGAVITVHGWLCDDAFISFRTIDNWQHGLGLTWNPAERVQTYTHPLWMLLVSLASWGGAGIGVTAIVVSLVLSLGTMIVLLWGVARGPWGVLCLGATLCLSRAFTDYSTSGLENPLTHFLLAVFVASWLRQEGRPSRALWLSAVAGLLVWNRMDTLLLVLPALVWMVARAERRLACVKALTLGFLPFLLWEAFALFYYGFPFPNTAYAKLNANLTWVELVVRSHESFLASLIMDPITLLSLAAGLLTGLAMRRCGTLPLVLGVLLYLAWFARTGGDFMAGRFFTAPLLVGAVLLAWQENLCRTRFGVSLLFGLVLLGAASWNGLERWGPGAALARAKEELPVFSLGGVADERAFYREANGLLPYLLRPPGAPAFSSHLWALRGRAARLRGRRDPVVAITVGMFGFFAGPEVHVLDQLALCDPLLARLPFVPGDQWRVGHFLRDPPKGYRESLTEDQNLLEDPGLHEYYEHLRRVIRGPLWDWQRLRSIATLNLGVHDHLIDRAMGG